MAERNIVSIILQGKDLASDDLKRVNKGLQDLDQTLAKVQRSMVRSGAAIAVALGLAVKASADFEAGLVNALTLVPETGAAFQNMASGMGEDAEQLSRELNVSGALITEAYYQVLSTGAEATSESFGKLTETGIKLAKVTGLDLSFSIETLADVISASSLDMAENVEQVANMIFQGSILSQTTVPQIAEALREAQPLAAGFGQDLSTTIAILDGFAKAGTKASLAGVAFRQIFSRLAAPSDDAAEALNDLNVQVFDSEKNFRNFIDILIDLQGATARLTPEQKALTLARIFDARAVSRVNLLLNQNLDVLKDFEGAIEGATQLEDAFQKKLDTLAESLGRVKLGVDSVRRAAGDELAPSIKEASSVSSELLFNLSDYIRTTPGVTSGFAILAATLLGGGGAIAAFRGLLKLMPTLLRFLGLLTPQGRLIAAIVTGLGIMAGAITKVRGETEEFDRALRDLSKAEGPRLFEADPDTLAAVQAINAEIKSIKQTIDKTTPIRSIFFEGEKTQEEAISALESLAEQIKTKAQDIEQESKVELEVETKVVLEGTLEERIAAAKGRLQNIIDSGEGVLIPLLFDKSAIANELQRIRFEAQQEADKPIELKLQTDLLEKKLLDINTQIRAIQRQASAAGPRREVEGPTRLELLEGRAREVRANIIDVLGGISEGAEEEIDAATEEILRQTEQAAVQIDFILSGAFQSAFQKGVNIGEAFFSSIRASLRDFLARQLSERVSAFLASQLTFLKTGIKVSTDFQLAATKTLTAATIAQGAAASAAATSIQSAASATAAAAQAVAAAAAANAAAAGIPGGGGIGFFPTGLPIGFLSFLQGGGTILPSHIQRPIASGTVTRGFTGRDSVPALLGRGETVIDSDLTTALRDLVDNQPTGQGQSIIIQAGIVNTSAQEATRFGREINRSSGRFRKSNMVQGSL